mmetsp:Transcript_16477/g.14386  ORF Transcript_16477/g.14386 Transcript_16477/m.14386 type:complete len:132 (+) Transcript_16477:233-628(+)
MKRPKQSISKDSEIDPEIDHLLASNYETIRKWEQIIIPEFENERLLIELEAQKRFQNEIEEFKESAKTDNKYKFRPSTELLNLTKQIEMVKWKLMKQTFTVQQIKSGETSFENYGEIKMISKQTKLEKGEK